MDPNDALRQLGERIRQLRRARKLSRRIVAELAGVHENTLKAIERGDGNPTYRVMLRLADALDVPIESLLKQNVP